MTAMTAVRCRQFHSKRLPQFPRHQTLIERCPGARLKAAEAKTALAAAGHHTANRAHGLLVLIKRHLSASQRLAKSLGQSIFLRAKPPINPFQASIAPATWQVINAFVADGAQRQLGLDRASRRHGGVDAE